MRLLTLNAGEQEYHPKKRSRALELTVQVPVHLSHYPHGMMDWNQFRFFVCTAYPSKRGKKHFKAMQSSTKNERIQCTHGSGRVEKVAGGRCVRRNSGTTYLH